MKDYQNEVNQLATMESAKYTVPIFFENHKNHVQFNGSGVLVKSVNKHFLITATHVLDQMPDRKFVYTIGKNKSINILDDAVNVKKLVDSPQNKNGDITAFELSSRFISDLDPMFYFLSENYFHFPVIQPPGLTDFLVAGYPGTKADNPKRYHDNKLSFRAIKTNLTELKWYDKFNYSFNDHTLVELPKFINEPNSGDKVHMFNPAGLSGGGLWMISSQYLKPQESPIVKLTGILIENETNGHRCMIATRFIHVFYLLKNGLNASFRKSP